MKRYFKLNNVTDITKGYTELSRKKFYTYKLFGNHYFIDLGHSLMETSEEDYRDFNKVIDREKYLTKLDVYFGKISYHAIQNEEGEDVYGEELLEDENINVEETAIESVFTEEMWTRLPKALSTLSDSDRELIHYLFHENLSEREIEKKYFIPRKTVSYRKKRIFATLKKLIE